jgi:catechol 2,3-dioxygenase-like lactoylglutathione lyase family enzyme
MTLRVEVFPDNLDAFVDFYTEVLGFTLAVDQRATEFPYAAVERDAVRIGAARTWEHWPRAIRSNRTCSGAPGGLTDFRLHDPAGYYLRITSRP